MKLYDFSVAPGPRRVRMFLAEKGVSVPTVEINTREMGQFNEDFRAKNPTFTIPVLELDDGTCISESVAICRYFEDTQPTPSLFGPDAKSRAVIEMWNRRAELLGYSSIADVVRNSLPLFEDRGIPGVESGFPQIAELADRGRKAAVRFSQLLDAQLGEHPFVAGDEFSIADITAYIAYDFGKRAEVVIPDDCGNVSRWWQSVDARPSARA